MFADLGREARAAIDGDPMPHLRQALPRFFVVSFDAAVLPDYTSPTDVSDLQRWRRTYIASLWAEFGRARLQWRTCPRRICNAFINLSQSAKVPLRIVPLAHQFAPSFSHTAGQLWPTAQKLNRAGKLTDVPYSVQKTGFSLLDQFAP